MALENTIWNAAIWDDVWSEVWAASTPRAEPLLYDTWGGSWGRSWGGSWGKAPVTSPKFGDGVNFTEHQSFGTGINC